MEENRYEEALNTFREAVRGSRDVQTLNYLAWILTNEEHDYLAALEILEEAVRMKPDAYFPYSLTLGTRKRRHNSSSSVRNRPIVACIPTSNVSLNSVG